ncbi:MAG: hypothetical protein ABI679_03920 [Gemmatimonadota bacterium]
MTRSMRVVQRSFGAGLMVLALLATGARIARAQDDDADRTATRERVRTALKDIGTRMGVTFRQSEKQPFNFVGLLTDGLNNSEKMEILVMIGHQDVLTVQAYPHVTGDKYINVDRSPNSVGLMRKLLSYNDGQFFYWGMDDVYDVFAAYTFTLESGFPTEALDVVLRSVPLLDKKVGEMGLLIGR